MGCAHEGRDDPTPVAASTSPTAPIPPAIYGQELKGSPPSREETKSLLDNKDWRGSGNGQDARLISAAERI